MGIPLLANWFVCALGAAVFAACGPLSRAGAVGAVTAFAATAWLVRTPLAPSAPAVGVLAALAGAAVLFQTRWLKPARIAPPAAGACAGLWTGVLAAQGLPLPLAIIVALALPLATIWLRAHRDTFAPPVLRDEALLFIVMLALAAGAAPAIVDGWHAAANLSLQAPAQETARVGIPAWTLAVSITALLSGSVYSLWSRR